MFELEKKIIYIQHYEFYFNLLIYIFLIGKPSEMGTLCGVHQPFYIQIVETNHGTIIMT